MGRVNSLWEEAEMKPTFTATIEHVNQTTSKATVRSHTLLVDRSVAKGGFDLGPAGGEDLLASLGGGFTNHLPGAIPGAGGGYLRVSLGGCFTSHFRAAIRAREAAVTNVRVVVTGTLAGTPERFAGFTMDVSAESQDSRL